jgi:biopolymer transport protein ExbD
MGKEIATSRERILPLLAKLAQYEPKLTVFIRADPDVDMASLEACLSEVTKQGFHSFLIQDILWGTTDLKTGGVP